MEDDSSSDSSALYTQDYPPTILNTIIPRFVQRRVATIRSLRDIAGTYVRPGLSRRSQSIASSSSITSLSLSPPPPPYSAEPPTSDDDEETDEEEEEEMNDEYTSAPNSRPSTSGSSTPSPRSTRNSLIGSEQLQTQDDLVRFKYTSHGLMLLARSAQDRRSSNQQIHDEYQRRLYLDGVAYLLRGLPDQLSEAERTSLRDALPDQLLHVLCEQQHPDQQTHPPHPRSLLQAIISALVYWAFLAVALLLPHLKSAASQAYAFERRHRLGEHCLQQAIVLTQMTYDQAMRYAFAIWTLNDGMIGRRMTEAGLWCAQNVGQGVGDGLMEAAAALRRMQEEQRDSRTL